MMSVIVDGVLYIPMIVEIDDVIGDAMVPINESNPDYEYWYGIAENISKDMVVPFAGTLNNGEWFEHDKPKKLMGLFTIFKYGTDASGNWGHSGRPGQVGGSGEGDATESGNAGRYVTSIGNTDNAKLIRAQSEKAIGSLARDMGMTRAQYQTNVEQFLKDKLEKTPVAIRVRENTLSRILNDGKFKNQFETGKTGTGKTVSQKKYNEVRREYEETVYGMTKDTPNQDHPIYGYYLKGDDKSNAWLSDYGKISVVLNDSVKNRSTFTDTDSLDINYGSPRLYPSPANKIGRAHV